MTRLRAVALLALLIGATAAADEAAASAAPDAKASKVLSLSQACGDDALRLCQTSSVYNHRALACLEDRKHELTPVCREWHDARMQCQRDIDSYGACETCPQTCRFIKSPLQCAQRIGLKKFEHLVGLHCAESAYFRSIQRLVVMHERKREKRFGEGGEAPDPEHVHIIKPDPDDLTG